MKDSLKKRAAIVTGRIQRLIYKVEYKIAMKRIRKEARKRFLEVREEMRSIMETELDFVGGWKYTGDEEDIIFTNLKRKEFDIIFADRITSDFGGEEISLVWRPAGWFDLTKEKPELKKCYFEQVLPYEIFTRNPKQIVEDFLTSLAKYKQLAAKIYPEYLGDKRKV